MTGLAVECTFTHAGSSFDSVSDPIGHRHFVNLATSCGLNERSITFPDTSAHDSELARRQGLARRPLPRLLEPAVIRPATAPADECRWNAGDRNLLQRLMAVGTTGHVHARRAVMHRRYAHIATDLGAPSLKHSGRRPPTQQASQGAFVVGHKPATAGRTWTARRHCAKSICGSHNDFIERQAAWCKNSNRRSTQPQEVQAVSA
jgi:hypothetical protein